MRSDSDNKKDDLIERALECVCPRCAAKRDEWCHNPKRKKTKNLHQVRIGMVR